MKRLVVSAVFAVFAVFAVMVQVDSAMAVDAASMEQVLLNPRGFDVDWTCGGKSGHSRVIFLREAEKIVAEIRVVDIENADINNPINYGAESCTSYAKLTDSGIIFYGCSSASWDIPLTYDPGNKEIPFKGSGPNCSKIALSPH